MGYNSVDDIIGLSAFIQPWLPPKVAKSREIPTKFDLTAVQGHPRSSLSVNPARKYFTKYDVLLFLRHSVFAYFRYQSRFCCVSLVYVGIQESSDRGKDIEYVVRRLIRGLASSRECARLGFSTALTCVRHFKYFV